MAEQAENIDHKQQQLQKTLEDLDPIVRNRVERLIDIQTQHDEVHSRFLKERAAILSKYQALFQPLYSQRYEIVNGEEGVPEFWLTAMKNNEALTEEITDRDEAALVSLRDIKYQKLNLDKGFKLEFFFDANPYFKNSVLTKTYHMTNEHDGYDAPELEKVTGTEIEWYPGKCLTQRTRVLRRNGKEAVKKTEDCDSFFNFFKPPVVPENKEELDEESSDQLQSKIELDYHMGATIQEKIVPRAVSWFTGEAVVRADDSWLEDDDEDDDENEDDDEDEEDDEDEDEDDEDEDDEDEDDDEDDGLNNDMNNSGYEGGSNKLQHMERPPECSQM
ncbi:Nucleosome assembly protein 1;2 [Linum perenne]